METPEATVAEPTTTGKVLIQDEETQQIYKILDEVEADAKLGKKFLALSVDSQFVSLIRQLRANPDPSAVFRFGLEFQSKLFVNHLLYLLGEADVFGSLSMVACQIEGSLCDVWILTLPGQSIKAVRLRIFEILRLAQGNEIFCKVRLDYMVADATEVEIPEGYVIHRPAIAMDSHS